MGFYAFQYIIFIDFKKIYLQVIIILATEKLLLQIYSDKNFRYYNQFLRKQYIPNHTHNTRV